MHQSPEIEDSTESKDDPNSPRYAMSGFHITMCGFQYAAAIDARHRTGHSGMTWPLRSMTRSDDRRESQERRRWRVCARDDGKGQGYCRFVGMRDGASES